MTRSPLGTTGAGRGGEVVRYVSIRLVQVAIVTVILIAWHVAGANSEYWDLVISRPESVLAMLGTWVDDPEWWYDLCLTLQEAGIGYLLGVVVAVVLVAVVSSSSRLEAFLSPFLAAVNALPKIVLAPIFVLWFGIGVQSKVYFVAAALFFIVFFGVHTGLKTIDRALLDNARVLGASTRQVILTVHAPAVVTWLFASLRLSAATALLAAVVAEYLGATGGLGYRISSARSVLQTDAVIAGIFVIAVVAVIADRILVRVERHFSRWRAF